MSNNGQLVTEKKPLRPNQLRALKTWVSTADATQAAAAGQVARKTFYKWQNDPAWQAALTQAQADAIDALSTRLVALGDKALDALEQTLNDDEATHHQRLRASEITLNSLLRLRELATLEARILALESRINGYP